jgi:glycosyltransferase involved in cell wall biosynthesis
LVTLVALPTNRGLAGAVNAGLAACRFDVVARQDADDRSHPDRFRLTVPLVQSGELDLVGSAMREITDPDPGAASPKTALTSDGTTPDERAAVGERGSPDEGEAWGEVTASGKVRRYPLTADLIWRRAKFMNPLAHPTVVTRRSLILAAGGYRDLFHLEDYDLWVRLLQAGAKASNRPEPLVDYRVSQAGLRRRGGWKTLRAEFALQRQFLSSGFTNRLEWIRNITVRGTLELAPPPLLRYALTRSFTDQS